MMSIFIMFFNLIIFVFVAGIIAKNVMNIKNVSEKFKTMYEQEGKEEVYRYMDQNYSRNAKKQENINFDDTMKSNNNPIREKKERRGSI